MILLEEKKLTVISCPVRQLCKRPFLTFIFFFYFFIYLSSITSFASRWNLLRRKSCGKLRKSERLLMGINFNGLRFFKITGSVGTVNSLYSQFLFSLYHYHYIVIFNKSRMRTGVLYGAFAVLIIWPNVWRYIARYCGLRESARCVVRSLKIATSYFN